MNKLRLMKPNEILTTYGKTNVFFKGKRFYSARAQAKPYYHAYFRFAKNISYGRFEDLMRRGGVALPDVFEAIARLASKEEKERRRWSSAVLAWLW